MIGAKLRHPEQQGAAETAAQVEQNENTAPDRDFQGKAEQEQEYHISQQVAEAPVQEHIGDPGIPARFPGVEGIRPGADRIGQLLESAAVFAPLRVAVQFLMQSLGEFLVDVKLAAAIDAAG